MQSHTSRCSSMIRGTWVLTAALVGALCLVAPDSRADGIAPQDGIEARSGARITTALGSADDTDDVHFVGLPGQRVRATLRSRPADKDAPLLVGTLALQTAAGDLLDEATGTRAVIDFTLDAGGQHTLRVSGTAEGPIGAYRLDVRHNNPRLPKQPVDSSSDATSLEFEVAAGPGVRVGFSLTWRRGRVRFDGLRDPQGTTLEAFNTEVRERRRRITLALRALPAGSPTGRYRVRF